MPASTSAAAAGLLGLLIGSFLNVVVHRVPAGRSISHPGSSCPSCGSPIRARDNVPVLSWVALGGRCRSCRAPISWQYPAVELLTAVLFAALGARYPWSIVEAAFLAFTAGGVAVAVIDARHHVIPRTVVYVAGAAAFALLLAAALARGDLARLGVAVVAGAATFAVFLGVHLARPNGMGFGDVRLAGVIGLVVGWLGPGVVFVAVFVAFLAGALIGVPLALRGGRGRKAVLPFGPFLVAGSVVGLLVGPQLVGLWLR